MKKNNHVTFKLNIPCSKHYFKYYIFNTKNEIHEFDDILTTRLRKKDPKWKYTTFDYGALTLRHINEHNGKVLPLLGYILFSKEQFDYGTIAHEMFHVTKFYIDNFGGDNKLYNTLDKEEKLAGCLGDLVNNFMTR